MNRVQTETMTTDGAIQVVADIVPGSKRRIMARIRDHEVIMDIRKARGGDDTAPAPPEVLVVALGGCMVNLIRLMAAEKNAALEDLRVTIAGGIDPSLAMGLPSDNRAGFIEINATVAMEIDLTPDEQDRFIDEFNRRCPLCDTIMKGTRLHSRFLFQAADAEI